LPARGKSGEHDPQMEPLRWPVARLRVQRFAQELKAPVSLKLLEQMRLAMQR
jgi:hypothetical protein